ncbi:MAG: hypothetical protein JWQ17_42 [Tardiphaga sp.]|jgi:hypothetical protein|nr:hypothetical protein [Tardiphaga sp.]
MGTLEFVSKDFQAGTDTVVPNTDIREIPECRPTMIARKGNPRFGWVIDVLWVDGETEVIKGFATEHETVEWINQHSKGLARRDD